MPAQPVEEFLAAAQRSGLMSEAETRICASVLPERSDATQESVAAALVDHQKLTRYQADLLLAGRGEECVLAGRYRILEPLGAGGMGAVYKATDVKLDRIVALKVMAAQHVSNPEAVERFRREAKALAKVAHPGIVQAFDADADRGQQFLVMEYVEGHSLLKVLQQLGRLPATLAADYLYQAAVALHHAHGRGLIHRDVKPANMLLTPERRVKLLDLGLARFVQDELGDAGLTREGFGMGTPDYVAPEQFRDAHRADARSDVYSLGCSLYHLLTGHVPFPGSSMSEKAAAHESQEPPPIEARCPDAPSGLVCAVQKMMAKQPADRFQTAGEVAEALSPYVASSSVFALKLKETSTWQGSQLGYVLGKPPPKRAARPWPWLVGGAAATLAFVTLSLFALWWFNPQGQTADPGGGARPESKTGAEQASGAPLPDPDLITVSQDANAGGRFRTLREALNEVKAGQTIRVLDDKVYDEALTITRASTHRGITLEAPRGATIAPSAGQVAVAIFNVPDVTLRGFRLVAHPEGIFMVGVIGKSSGVVLEDLDISPGRAGEFRSITVEQLSLADHEPPVIIQNCHVRRAFSGVRLSGIADDYRTAMPLNRVCVRNNTFVECHVGIMLLGSVRQVQVVGNRVLGASLAGIQVENVLEGTGDVLIANNTIHECMSCLRLRDDAKKGVLGNNVQFRNNLLLDAKGADVSYLDSGGDQIKGMGPGDTALVPAKWRLEHNWREIKTPIPTEGIGKEWVAPGPADVRKDAIPVLARDAQSPDFLRPAKDSPLATEGAGKIDPRLPSYVGAVPPAGVAAWDWDRTWRMPKDAQLLTVSKDARDGGQFRTINAALKVAKPWTTIRVLDDAAYADAVVFDKATAHQGICLEAVRGARLVWDGAQSEAILIAGVPHVRVRGFGCECTGGSINSFMVRVTGLATGVVIDDLRIKTSLMVSGIALDDCRSEPGGPPIVVERCHLQVGYDGIRVHNSLGSAGAGPRGIVVRGNRIAGALRGMQTWGPASDVHFVGNLLWNCGQCALQIVDLDAHSRGILLANNTALKSGAALRFWDEDPFEVPTHGQVQVLGNLLCQSRDGDIVSVRSAGDNQRPGDHKTLDRLWIFRHNWRDLVGSERVLMPPLGAAERRLEQLVVESQRPADESFMRPPADSPLATGGAGKDDPSLPTYAGAVPPKGVEPWDWDKTWRWRTRKERGGP